MIRTFDFILKAKYNKAFMEQLEKSHVERSEQ